MDIMRDDASVKSDLVLSALRNTAGEPRQLAHFEKKSKLAKNG